MEIIFDGKEGDKYVRRGVKNIRSIKIIDGKREILVEVHEAPSYTSADPEPRYSVKVNIPDLAKVSSVTIERIYETSKEE